MINAIYGTKVGMTQLFDEDGMVIPVTVIEAAPNTVCQIKTTETDGYEAVQLGFGTIKENKVNKPMGGHFAKHGVSPMRHLREVRVDSASEHELGEKVTVANFAEVKKVDVTGTSKVLCVATILVAALVDMAPTSIVLLVRLVSAQAPRVCSKAFAFRATWVAIPSPPRILKLFVLTKI